MISMYPACFFEEEDGQYSVVFPDLNWLSTSGADQNEAYEKAMECLAGYLYSNRREGVQTPPASDLRSIDLRAVGAELDDPDPHGFVSTVAVDVDQYAKAHFERSVKKTLTIPAWLNEAALERNINFSQVLQEALVSKIQAGRL